MKRGLSALVASMPLLAGCTVTPEYSPVYKESAIIDSLFYFPYQEIHSSVWHQTQGFVGISEYTISEKSGIIFHCDNENHLKHIAIGRDLFEQFNAGDELAHHYQLVYMVTRGLDNNEKKREFQGYRTTKVHPLNTTCELCTQEKQ